MGLIQRAIEKIGIPTISISILREYTDKVKPPRAVYLHWPFGHPLGEPDNPAQQAAVLYAVMEAFETIDTPGRVLDIGWRWRRETYPPCPWGSELIRCKT